MPESDWRRMFGTVGTLFIVMGMGYMVLVAIGSGAGWQVTAIGLSFMGIVSAVAVLAMCYLWGNSGWE